MLLLADRNFYSYRLWTAAGPAGTGAELLWRVKASMHLPVARELPDGSWLAHVNDPAAVQARLRRHGQRRRRGSTLAPATGPLPGITVRVIEFALTVTAADGGTRTERYRLLTTLADWRKYPAAELAAGYARRWAIETGYQEFKTYLRGPGRRLRGRTPELARQELWAYLVIYQAIRTIIARAAAGAAWTPAGSPSPRPCTPPAAMRAAATPRRRSPRSRPASSIPGPSSAAGRAYPRLTRRAAPGPAAAGPGPGIITTSPDLHHHHYPARPGHPHRP